MSSDGILVHGGKHIRKKEGGLMIKGIGLDIAEIDRIGKMILRQPKFIDRILTDREKDAYHSYSGTRKTEYAAGRFAAKEAFSKAMGTGIGGALSFQDIEIIRDEFGRPMIVKPDMKGFSVHLSITHTREYAAAQVIIESSSS